MANAAAAAAAAGIGPAGDANEAVRSLRLRQAIMGDTAGALEGVFRSGDAASASTPDDSRDVDSPSNSFSRHAANSPFGAELATQQRLPFD